MYLSCTTYVTVIDAEARIRFAENDRSDYISYETDMDIVYVYYRHICIGIILLYIYIILCINKDMCTRIRTWFFFAPVV